MVAPNQALHGIVCLRPATGELFVERQLSSKLNGSNWVEMRLTSLRVHRRKAVVDFSLPGSSRSSPSAADPNLTLSVSQEPTLLRRKRTYRLQRVFGYLRS